ncbi:MAG: restriction endonuclease [Candidatus Heimdallarchaeota archaeon]|nr:restriction endonuclease [Candidatus Heimdallarchaeota archaeon]
MRSPRPPFPRTTELSSSSAREAQALSRAEFSDRSEPTAKDHGFDFILKLGKKKVLVEVKAWKSPIPTRMVMMVLDVLRGAMSREGADEAILVTRATVNLPEKISEYGHIKILTLRELRNYLAHETYG